ncbi:hypothetical protein TWF481_002680 [Arthrobotrys musiformis]|uniref:Uncharacterized protein n=1 Tax=Arthrobotrys musiformis TaxID=47236 RepID=A0AAV9VS40_9PEZI
MWLSSCIPYLQLEWRKRKDDAVPEEVPMQEAMVSEREQQNKKPTAPTPTFRREPPFTPPRPTADPGQYPLNDFYGIDWAQSKRYENNAIENQHRKGGRGSDFARDRANGKGRALSGWWAVEGIFDRGRDRAT